jgi:hypothetical protein
MWVRKGGLGCCGRWQGAVVTRSCGDEKRAATAFRSYMFLGCMGSAGGGAAGS